MKILGLDLGTNTGYCYNDGSQIICGAWKLATAKEIKGWGKDRQCRTKDPRIERLCKKISDLGEFDVVIYEDIQFSSYTAQVQLWSSFRATVWLCSITGITECVPVSTLKYFATGAGNATKEMMISSLKKFHPEVWYPNMGDDAADAAWLWVWGQKNLCRTKQN